VIRLPGIIATLSLLLALPIVLCAQVSSRSIADSANSVDTSASYATEFGPQPNHADTPVRNAWGIDALISNNGFGLGSFYRREYTDVLSGFVSFSISEAKDDNEKEYIDPYFGVSFVPGKVNRFLVMPLMVGVQRRMFKDDIVDNFRPYVSAAAGPTMIYVFPYTDDFFSALGKGRPKYTVGGYIGAGAFLGSGSSSLFGLNIRYYFIPYSGGLESMQLPSGTRLSMKQFGGFFITLSVGSSW
jgi:hypothetical protein